MMVIRPRERLLVPVTGHTSALMLPFENPKATVCGQYM